MTSRESGLDKVGKRMPYTIPDGFFNNLEESVWNELKSGGHKSAGAKVVALRERRTKSRFWVRSAIAVAASAALAIVVCMKYFSLSHVSAKDVDQAFCQLSADDQAFLLSVYQEDLFVNE